MMVGVQPITLRKRLQTLMESGCDEEKAAAKNLQVWKAMLHKETCLDWESEIRLKKMSTRDFRNSNSRHGRNYPTKFRQRLRGNSAQCGKRFIQLRPTHRSYTKMHTTNTNFQRKPVRRYDSTNKGNSKNRYQRPSQAATKSAFNSGSGKRNITCFNCNKQGHYAKDYRAPMRSLTNYR